MPDPTPHKPTEATKAEVGALVSFGNTQEDIARYLGISVDTLVKYYRYELDNSVMVANAKVANRLFRKATEDDDLSAQVFWLKTRGRWRQTDDPNQINPAIEQDSIRRRQEELAREKERDY